MSSFAVLFENYPELRECETDILAAFDVLANCLADDGTIYLAGNGGSCADADHISGELLKGFIKKRPISDADRKLLCALDEEDGKLLADNLQYGLPAISLMHFPGVMSAVENDIGGEFQAAQILLALGRPGDVLFGISTSGNARNIALAARVARLRGIKVVGLTGCSGGKLHQLSDVSIKVPADKTFRIQEYHLPIYHAICAELENKFFAC